MQSPAAYAAALMRGPPYSVARPRVPPGPGPGPPHSDATVTILHDRACQCHKLGRCYKLVYGHRRDSEPDAQPAEPGMVTDVHYRRLGIIAVFSKMWRNVIPFA